ncbi:cobalt/nickel transport protein [Haloactinospora alba]|uniref:Cobalt transport protein CbiN n=1 Tax=Haloactinospora alba TaxID=405555 RepID=A0A543NKU0_9ACTN|nr:energy-coupling factor ABC transporter substrate-binding protein [Haloactinospora alba]TQN32407.1 cobalt/nickel transport protein [Haloactinospora alba]
MSQERTTGRPTPVPRTWTTWLMVFGVAALVVLPLVIGAGDHLAEPFGGADGQAEETATEINPDYEPWFTPLYEAPSGEIESGLFALQAAVGAGVIGYYFGVARTRSRMRRASATDTTDGASRERAAPADDTPDTHH